MLDGQRAFFLNSLLEFDRLALFLRVRLAMSSPVQRLLRGYFRQPLRPVFFRPYLQTRFRPRVFRL